MSESVGAASRCVLEKTVAVQAKVECAYDLSVAFVDDRTDTSFLDLGTDIAAHGMNLATGGIFDFPGLLRNERKPGLLVMRPNKGHENYLHCGHSHLIASINDVIVNQPTIKKSHGTWSWSLPRQGLFEGRNWYKGHWAWVSHHPRFTPDLKACKELAELTVRAMENKRRSIEATQKKPTAPPYQPHVLPH